jgi:superfamily II DNA or RNA helicase
VDRIAKRTGCPFCLGRRVSATNSLATLRPDLSAEWHPTKNGTLTPATVLAGGVTQVWWKCANGPDHEWPATLNSRVRKGSGCPFCAGQRVSTTNSLAGLYPDVAAEWHPTKNGGLTPDRVVAGSSAKAWWTCANGPDHEWSAVIGNRAKLQAGCPFCAGQRASVTNSLANLFPEVAAEWHPTKNGVLTPEKVVAGSNAKAWWKCPKGPDHEWQATLNNRTASRSGCPCCANQQVSVTNSLATVFPAVAAEWHPTKNGDLKPERVIAGSDIKAWWVCPRGPDHEWQATVGSRTFGGRGCPQCRGFRVSVTNSLAARHPNLAAEWHPTKNGTLTPEQVVTGAKKKIWWKCLQGPDHEWEAIVSDRTGKQSGCPFCAGRLPSVTNSLANLFPEVAAEWHPTKNGDLTPDRVPAGTNTHAWWQCRKEPSHEWQARVVSRTGRGLGCPLCNQGWTVDRIRWFVASLLEHLEAFTPAELYVLFQQAGISEATGRGRGFVKALVTGRFPREELERFVQKDASVVDRFVVDPTLTLEAANLSQGANKGTPYDIDEPAVSFGDEPVDAVIAGVELGDQHLPVVEARDILASLTSPLVATADQEAVEFLLASKLAKLWKHAYADPGAAVRQAEAFVAGEYASRVRDEFLDQYKSATSLEIPKGYAFTVDGRVTPPNLMQRHVAVQVRDQNRVGNWSGTGAGKTLSAILASRVIGAELTVICCPNSVVEGWQRAILDAFPGSQVATKTFGPNEADGSDDPVGFAAIDRAAPPRYVVLNYEMFQQPDSATRVREFADRERVDLLVIDEIHHTKQRQVEDMSRRRQLVAALASAAAERNPSLRVLGMSATPVINNLQEGKSLVELVTGVQHGDLSTTATVPNCMRLHQHLIRLGTRWMPEYSLAYEQIEVPVDCGLVLDEIRALGSKGHPLALEQILTRIRLPVIRQHITSKTLVYTHYVQGIDRLLYDALVQDGWRVGFFTGDDKSGLDAFLNGDLDVLIGSSAIGTGIDGLQRVCDQLIVNVLPWTAAEFEQLKGRVFRQGQRSDTVTMVLPLTYAEVNGERWSWCDSKMARLRFKKSIADAAVDGVVPEGHLRSPAQAFQDALAWLARLDSGIVEEVVRPPIVVPLPDANPSDVGRRARRYGDFSAMNRTWNGSRSEVTHRRMQVNPEEWAQYHTLYREARKDWAVVPYEEIRRWCEQRSGYVIGDFGCGEATLAQALKDRHVVHSFDHVAINDAVTVCDMAHTPLEDNVLDVAVFSLSLMGTNVSDYLREAHRVLKLDGHLHILEATGRFADRDGFVRQLKAFGFEGAVVKDTWKFTHIWTRKTGRQPESGATLTF